MNIKQAELESKVSKCNIRFYEQKGLIKPLRNLDNDYREYSQEDIERLKRIRMLRMVDMPLEQIRDVLEGNQKLKAAAAEQKKRLKLQSEKLESAIRFCEFFEAVEDDVNVDNILQHMEMPENKQRLFTQWSEDYRSFVRMQRKKTFTFIPDSPVTNSSEFTMALCEYGIRNKENLVITKEGMYPEFTIEGVEYTAERIYTTVCRIPTAVIRCTALHPEALERKQSAWKKLLFTAVHGGWIVLVLILMNWQLLFRQNWHEMLKTWEGWVLIVTMLILVGVDMYRWWILRYNERQG